MITNYKFYNAKGKGQKCSNSYQEILATEISGCTSFHLREKSPPTVILPPHGRLGVGLRDCAGVTHQKFGRLKLIEKRLIEF